MGPRRAGLLPGATAIAAQVLAFSFRRFCSAKISSSLACEDCNPAEPAKPHRVIHAVEKFKEADMGFGRGALLWLLGIPLPIILILALFMHH